MKINFLYILILFFVVSCSAPKYDEEFLKDEQADYYQNLIIHPDIDSTNAQKIDTLNMQMAIIEKLITKLPQKEILQMVDSIQKSLLEIKNKLSSPVWVERDQKLDYLEKKDIELSKKISSLEKKIKDVAANSGKPPIEKPVSKTINTFDDYNTLYELAVNQFQARKYDDAIQTFRVLLNSKLQKPDMIDKIYFWLGQCFFAKGDYKQSTQNFNKVLTIPKTNKSDEALMMMGAAAEKQNDIEGAREAYQRLVDTFPNSKYFKKAKLKLKILI